jgi:P-type Ca2+ transporter type 2B
VVALFTAFIGSVVLGDSPLTSVQMLWVNLIMDTFAALALATEPPSADLLKEKPHSREDAIVTSSMWRNIIGQSIFQIIVLTCLLFLGNPVFGIPTRVDENELWTEENGVLFTMVFHTFVFMQIFNEFNSKKLKSTEFNVFEGLFNNPLFIIIEGMTILIQILFVHYGGRALKVSRLDLNHHLICIGIGSLSLVVGVLVKLLPKRLFAFKMNDRERENSGLVRSLRTKSFHDKPVS